MQKIITECKLDGIEPPRFRTVCNSLSVEFAAPRDRLVGAGGPDGERVRSDNCAGSSDKDSSSSDNSSISCENVTMRSDKARFHTFIGTESSDKTYLALSGSEIRAFEILSNQGEVKSAEIAEALGMTQRGAAKLLGRLVAKGLVVACGASKNRRYRLLLDSSSASEVEEGGR